MKAVRFHEYGGPEVLRYEDAEQPVPGEGQVRLRVAATTFNPVDDGIRGGYLRGPFPVTLPHVPGIEVAGTVDTLGHGVDGVAVGDEIIGFLPMVGDGAAAEYAVAPAEVLTRAPSNIPLTDAAALPMVGLTAWQALFDDAKLTAGQRVLINGAGGAVGGYAVQLAKHAGAHVIATGSPRSRERLTSAGADEARSVRAVDVFVRSDREQLAHLVALVDRGELRVDVDRRVPLAELAAVHAEADAGTLRGRVVVVAPTS